MKESIIGRLPTSLCDPDCTALSADFNLQHLTIYKAGLNESTSDGLTPNLQRRFHQNLITFRINQEELVRLDIMLECSMYIHSTGNRT